MLAIFLRPVRLFDLAMLLTLAPTCFSSTLMVIASRLHAADLPIQRAAARAIDVYKPSILGPRARLRGLQTLEKTDEIRLILFFHLLCQTVTQEGIELY